MSVLTRISSNYLNKRLFALFLFILTSCTLLLLLNTRGSESLYWPGWYILRLSVETEVPNAVHLLSDSGVDGALSASSAEVSYMAIPRLERVSVDGLDSVLVTGDPRRDPYLSRISSLFESGGAELIYLPADRSLAAYRNILDGIKELSGWQLMDERTGIRFHVLVFIAAALIISVKPARIAAMLPLAVFVFFAVPKAVFPALLIYYLSPSNFRWNHKVRKRLPELAVYTGFFAAAASLFLTVGVDFFIPLCISLVSSEFIFTLAMRLDGRQIFAKRHEHQLFEPLSLTKSRIPATGKHYFPGLLAAIAVILTLFIPVPGTKSHPPVPYTVKSSEGFDDFASLHRLSDNQTASSLPDVSGLISSTAYHEGFLYGAEYRLPMPGDTLKVRSYSDNGDSIAVVESIITDYDEAWFGAVVNRELSRGPGRLFASLGGPSPVVTVTELPIVESGGFGTMRIILLSIAVLVMLMLVLLPTHVNQLTRGIYKPLLTVRRRAQAA